MTNNYTRLSALFGVLMGASALTSQAATAAPGDTADRGRAGPGLNTGPLSTLFGQPHQNLYDLSFNAASRQTDEEDAEEPARGNAWDFVYNRDENVRVVKNSSEIVGRLVERLKPHDQAYEYARRLYEEGGEILIAKMPTTLLQILNPNRFSIFGYFSPDTQNIVLNHRMSEDLMIKTLAHELRHGVKQYFEDGMLDMSVDAINDYTYTGAFAWLFTAEADAVTFATDVVYTLRENGDEAAWNANANFWDHISGFEKQDIEKIKEKFADEPYYGQLAAQAYDTAMEKTGNRAIAQARAFEAWGLSDNAPAAYEEQAHDLYRRSLMNVGYQENLKARIKGYGDTHDIGLHGLEAGTLEKLGQIGGANYVQHLNRSYIDPDTVRADISDAYREKEFQYAKAVDAYDATGTLPAEHLSHVPVFTVEQLDEYRAYMNALPHTNEYELGIKKYYSLKENGQLAYYDDYMNIINYYERIPKRNGLSDQKYWENFGNFTFETYVAYRESGLLTDFPYNQEKYDTPEEIENILADMNSTVLYMRYRAVQDFDVPELTSGVETYLKSAYELVSKNPEDFNEATYEYLLNGVTRYISTGQLYSLTNLYWHEFPPSDWSSRYQEYDPHVLDNNLRPEIEDIISAAYRHEGHAPPDYDSQDPPDYRDEKFGQKPALNSRQNGATPQTTVVQPG